MNIRQIVSRLCKQLGIGDLDADAREVALSYLNEAYEEMMRIYRPYHDIALEVPFDGRVTPGMLGETCGRVNRVFRGLAEVPFSVAEDGSVIVSGGGNLRFRCRYIPLYLKEDEDIPDFPEPFHGTLADYATWRFMCVEGKARRQRGEMFFARYLQRKASMHPEHTAFFDQGAVWDDPALRFG